MAEGLLYNPRAGHVNTREHGLPERFHICQSLFVNAAGAEFRNPLVSPRISRLHLVRISAMHDGTDVAGGNTILEVNDYKSGAPVALGTLTIPTALAAYTEVTATFESVPVDQTSFLVLEIGTDGGHEQIYATAYYAQSPLRR